MDTDRVWMWLSLPLVITCVHRMMVLAACARTAGKKPDAQERVPPVTWLRPLKSGVPGLAEKLERFVASLEDDDEAIFGVASGSEEERLGTELAQRDARVKVIACDAGAAANPKIAKLLAMSPHARHERWILADAEVRIDSAFARAFRAEWETSGTDALTAGYRFVGMKSWPQWLDALATVQTLWPGLELVRAYGRVRFTLGACTGIRREDVEKIGGWAVLGNELAEDHQLGQRLAAAGKSVRLSSAVLELETEPMTWREYWRHQRRVAVTYRIAAPFGTFGMILTRGFAISLLLAVVWPSPLTFINAVLIAGMHLLGVAFQEARLARRILWQVGLSLIADLIETICWFLAWFSWRVWWGGKWRAITWRGQFKTR